MLFFVFRIVFQPRYDVPRAEKRAELRILDFHFPLDAVPTEFLKDFALWSPALDSV